MATLKVYDGTQWQPVAGQGSPGQGIPSGGSTGTLLVKNSAANLDTSWTNPSVVAENAGGGQSRLAVNAPPVSTGPGLRVQPPVGTSPSLDVWGTYGQTQSHQILRVVDQNGIVGWHVDRYARPKQFIQAGSASGPTDPSGNLVVIFPEAFLSSLPFAVGTEASGVNLQCSIYSLTSTYVGFHLRTPTGGPVNGVVRVNWIAVEIRS